MILFLYDFETEYEERGRIEVFIGLCSEIPTVSFLSSDQDRVLTGVQLNISSNYRLLKTTEVI